jgi:hypothetical protein
VSEYGPALFVSRVDGAQLTENEQATLLRSVTDACRSLELTDADGGRIKPEVYDYNEYEPGALGILLYSSFLYSLMPEEVLEGEREGWQDEAALLASEVEKQAPGTYRFVCYGVEA